MMTLRPKEKKLLDVQEKKNFSAVFLQQKQLVSHSARSERPGRWQTTNPAPPPWPLAVLQGWSKPTLLIQPVSAP